MANVTIRNLDDKVVVRLKKRAKTSNRSLEAELREILTRAADTMTSRELRVIAERIAAMTPDVPQTDSAELIREDRDR
ncbi:MAG: plasmid stabilization protein [Kiloniellales bacterium]|jgi:plasmid stability protein